MDHEPRLADIRAAASLLANRAHRTPVLTSRAVDAIVGARLFFKCENLQKAGAFKIRGATNAVFDLDDAAAAKGVVTHSSGNFAAAMALAASWRGIGATVVMPSNSPAVKVAATEGYGARVVFCEPTLQAREDGARAVIAETGATFLHPYDDWAVIAGQGTCALELLEQTEDLDAVIAPVGGGGLLAGTALTVSFLSSGTRVLAGEPAGADDAKRSLAAGEIIPVGTPDTVADGLRTSLGEKTFPILQRLVEEIRVVDDATIVRAMRMIWERMKQVVEPSAAVSLAALLDLPESLRGKRIGVILSGGNVDLDALPWCDR